MYERVETAEEAHFLVRVGTWSAEDLERWANRRQEEEWEYEEFNVWDQDEEAA